MAKDEFDQMSFYLNSHLILAFWVVFIDTEITRVFRPVINIFFEMTGILP